MKYKLFKIRVISEEEALIFLNWIHGIETPFHLQVNEGNIHTIENGIQKLFWLSGFEALINVGEV